MGIHTAGIIGQCQPYQVFPGFVEGVRHDRSGRIGTVVQVPRIAHDGLPSCCIGTTRVEGQLLIQAYLCWQVVIQHKGCRDRRIAWRSTLDHRRKVTTADLVAGEVDGETARRVVRRGTEHLALQSITGETAKEGCTDAVAVVQFHSVRRRTAGGAQLGDQEAQRDALTRSIGTDGHGHILIVPIWSQSTSWVDQCAHAGVDRTVGQNELLCPSGGECRQQHHGTSDN